ncbi:MAG: LamG-like jellyroll fold domain-containing protein [Clostridia bacterium]
MKRYIYATILLVMVLISFNIAVIYAAPDVPNVTASTTCTTLTLSWTAQSEATSYTVSVNGDIRSGITGTTYTYTGLNPNTSYSYAVRADSATESSVFSSGQTITTNQLEVPAGITSDATETTITINWSTVPEATSYYVMRNNGEKQTVSGTTYTYTNLPPDYELGFAVCAAVVGTDGTTLEGAYSSTVTTKTLPEPIYNLEFDGSNSMNLGNSPDLKPTGDFTISMWIKPDNTNNRYSDIISCHGATGGYAIQQDGYTPNKYLFSYWNGFVGSFQNQFNLMQAYGSMLWFRVPAILYRSFLTDR